MYSSTLPPDTRPFPAPYLKVDQNEEDIEQHQDVCPTDASEPIIQQLVHTARGGIQVQELRGRKARHYEDAPRHRRCAGGLRGTIMRTTRFKRELHTPDSQRPELYGWSMICLPGSSSFSPSCCLSWSLLPNPAPHTFDMDTMRTMRSSRMSEM